VHESCFTCIGQIDPFYFRALHTGKKGRSPAASHTQYLTPPSTLLRKLTLKAHDVHAQVIQKPPHAALLVLDETLQGRKGCHIPADDLHWALHRRACVGGTGWRWVGLGELAEERERGKGHWQPPRAAGRGVPVRGEGGWTGLVCGCEPCRVVEKVFSGVGREEVDGKQPREGNSRRRRPAAGSGADNDGGAGTACLCLGRGL